MMEARFVAGRRRFVRGGEIGGGKERKSYNPSPSIPISSNSSKSASITFDLRFGCSASAFDLGSAVGDFGQGNSAFTRRGEAESDLERLVGVEGLETVDCFDQRYRCESVEAELSVVEENFEEACWRRAAHSGGAAEERELEEENFESGRRRGVAEGGVEFEEGVLSISSTLLLAIDASTLESLLR